MTIPCTAPRAAPRAPCGFTLLELLVSMTILTILIVSVGVIFNSASQAVGTSQALLDMMDSMRSTQRMLQRDLAGIDKRAFLVIRSHMLDPRQPASPRFDQIAFLAYGSFPNRTGADDATAPFRDATVANAAHIWWGQLVMERLAPPDSSFVIPDQTQRVPLDRLPTGVRLVDSQLVVNEAAFVLGRHATMLLPGPPDDHDRITPAGRALKAYRDIRYDQNPVPLIQGAGESAPAHITSSRFAAAGILPQEIIDALPDTHDAAAWAAYCYRFKALSTVYDTEIPDNPFVNGLFRMHPIVFPGVSSFQIDWTDGTTDSTGQLRWFGPTCLQGNPAVEHTPSDGDLHGDHYLAVFTGDNLSFWPKALRISCHVADPGHRLPGGRDLAEIISLPD